jgi:hypothetical protein
MPGSNITSAVRTLGEFLAVRQPMVTLWPAPTLEALRARPTLPEPIMAILICGTP